MSNVLVGFLLGAGLAAWVYSKVMRSSGGNTKNAAIVAASAGVGAMVVMTLIMGAINK